MKKRTVCFGWTKEFQRRMAHATTMMRAGEHKAAADIFASVKTDHRARVQQLRVVVW